MLELIPFYVLLCYEEAYDITVTDNYRCARRMSDIHNLVIDYFGFESISNIWNYPYPM